MKEKNLEDILTQRNAINPILIETKYKVNIYNFDTVDNYIEDIKVFLQIVNRRSNLNIILE